MLPFWTLFWGKTVKSVCKITVTKFRSQSIIRDLPIYMVIYGDIWQCVKTLYPLVNIKIAGKWMFIPLKMVLIGIDPFPYGDQPRISTDASFAQPSNFCPSCGRKGARQSSWNIVVRRWSSQTCRVTGDRSDTLKGDIHREQRNLPPGKRTKSHGTWWFNGILMWFYGDFNGINGTYPLVMSKQLWNMAIEIVEIVDFPIAWWIFP